MKYAIYLKYLGTVKLLGGKVEHLVKKGKVQSAPKPAAERGVEDGPPSFVPFSQYQPPARHKVPSSRVSNSRGAEQGTRYTGPVSYTHLTLPTKA